MIPGLSALVLAAVLTVAAVAKIRRPAATADGIAELGLVQPALLARLVPGAELLCAVTLLVAPGWGGIVSFALIAAFTVVLFTVLRSGRVVSCRCFGGVGDKPVSPLTLVRNIGLLLLAAIASAA